MALIVQYRIEIRRSRVDTNRDSRSTPTDTPSPYPTDRRRPICRRNQSLTFRTDRIHPSNSSQTGNQERTASWRRSETACQCGAHVAATPGKPTPTNASSMALLDETVLIKVLSDRPRDAGRYAGRRGAALYRLGLGRPQAARIHGVRRSRRQGPAREVAVPPVGG